VTQRDEPSPVRLAGEDRRKKIKCKRTGTEESWLVDSVTWKKVYRAADANDAVSHERNGPSPGRLKAGDAMRKTSSSSAKVRPSGRRISTGKVYKDSCD
jgi:hypothetical protein